MSTTETRKRAAILVLTIAFGLTFTLWISNERTAKVIASIQPDKKQITKPEVTKTNLIGLNRYEHFERNILNVRPQHYVATRRSLELENEEFPSVQNRSLAEEAGLRLSSGTGASDNNNKIATVDMREITISYQTKYGSLPTNSLTEWKAFINNVQLVISNRAAAEGYSMVINKNPLTGNGVPAFYFTGEIPDITEKIIAELNTSHRRNAVTP